MGAAVSADVHQVTLITLPAAKAGTYVMLALVPLRAAYFPSPEHLRDMYTLFNTDRVRATFWKNRPTPTLEEFYHFFVTSTEIICEADPNAARAIPVGVLGRKKGSEKWNWVGMFSCRNWNKDGQPHSNGHFLGSFKEYTGAYTHAESDIALSMYRAAFALYANAAMERVGHLCDVRWPCPVLATFTLDNSGTAGVLSRMFKYCAMKGDQNMRAPLHFSKFINSYGVEQHCASMSDEDAIRMVGTLLVNDPAILFSRQPSLAAMQPTLLEALGFPASHDEPYFLCNIQQQTNDSNFPANAPTKGNAHVLETAGQLSKIHDECRSRFHQSTVVDPTKTNLKLHQQLFLSFGLTRPQNALFREVQKQLAFIIATRLPAQSMHAVDDNVNRAMIAIAKAMRRASIFYILATDVPDRNALLDDACERDPCLVIAMLLAWQSGNDGAAEVALLEALAMSVPAAPDVHIVSRIVDLRLRQKLRDIDSMQSLSQLLQSRRVQQAGICIDSPDDLAAIEESFRVPLAATTVTKAAEEPTN